MGDLVNLNKFRKARQSRDEKRAAAANRGKYGRSKAELVEIGADRDRTARELEGKRIERKDPRSTECPQSDESKDGN
jgi:hypothetical protein